MSVTANLTTNVETITATIVVEDETIIAQVNTAARGPAGEVGAAGAAGPNTLTTATTTNLTGFISGDGTNISGATAAATTATANTLVLRSAAGGASFAGLNTNSGSYAQIGGENFNVATTSNANLTTTGSGTVIVSGAGGTTISGGPLTISASSATFATGSIATSQPLALTQTWTNAAVTYTGLQVNVTDSGPSNAASLLMDLQVGGASRLSVRKDGRLFFGNNGIDAIWTVGGRLQFTAGGAGPYLGVQANGVIIQQSASLSFSSGNALGDTVLTRDGAANTLAQRNGTAAQESRIYGTYTGPGNYRRLALKMDTAGVAQIVAEGGGSGASGNRLEFVTGGATRMTVTSAGNVGVGTSTPTFQLDADGTLAIGKITDTTSQGELMRLRVGSSGGSTGYISFKRAGGGNASYNFGLLGSGTLSIRQDGDSADAWSISSSGTVNSNKTFIFGSANGTISSESYFYNSSSGVETLPIRIANPSTGNLSNCAIGFRSINSVGTFYDYAKITGIKIGNWVGATPVGGIGFSVKNGSDAFVEAMRISNNGNVGIGTTSPTALLDVNGDTVRVRTARTPASAAAAGNAGDICWDADYIYVCTATDTWKRAAISTW